MRSGAGASNDNQPDFPAHRIRWEHVAKLKKSHQHLGNKGGGDSRRQQQLFYISYKFIQQQQQQQQQQHFQNY